LPTKRRNAMMYVAAREGCDDRGWRVYEMADSEKKCRILCIDDEPDILTILSATLGSKHEVVTANDGVEAVAMLDVCDADFIICDVRMPHMDGFQTVEAIRRHPDYTTAPVFFLTAEHGADKAKRGFASGGNLYLTKPFDPARLLQNIDFFLSESGCETRPKRFTAEEIPSRMSQPAETATAAPPAEVARIIIVCSDAAQLDRVCAALCDTYECVPCADAIASLQQMFRYDPDLLIVNPAIPGLSGWGLVQMVRNNKRLRGLPIILFDDPSAPLDERMVAAITDQPVIEAGAGTSDILAAAQRVTEADGFTPRPKTLALTELRREEETLRLRLETERVQAERQETHRRERYKRIQDFIDRDLA